MKRRSHTSRRVRSSFGDRHSRACVRESGRHPGLHACGLRLLIEPARFHAAIRDLGPADRLYAICTGRKRSGSIGQEEFSGSICVGKLLQRMAPGGRRRRLWETWSPRPPTTSRSLTLPSPREPSTVADGRDRRRAGCGTWSPCRCGGSRRRARAGRPGSAAPAQPHRRVVSAARASVHFANDYPPRSAGKSPPTAQARPRDSSRLPRRLLSVLGPRRPEAGLQASTLRLSQETRFDASGASQSRRRSCADSSSAWRG